MGACCFGRSGAGHRPAIEMTRVLIMTRIVLGLLLAFGCLMAATPQAEARKEKRKTNYNRYNYYYAPPSPRRYQAYPPASQSPNSGQGSECGNTDPARNYSDYPCWARRAFSPKGGGSG